MKPYNISKNPSPKIYKSFSPKIWNKVVICMLLVRVLWLSCSCVVNMCCKYLPRKANYKLKLIEMLRLLNSPLSQLKAYYLCWFIKISDNFKILVNNSYQPVREDDWKADIRRVRSPLPLLISAPIITSASGTKEGLKMIHDSSRTFTFIHNIP